MSSAAVGVMGVLLTMAFSNGFFGSMIDVMVGSGLGHVQIRPEGYEATRKSGLLIPDASELLKKFQSDSQNEFLFAPRLEREGLLRAGGFHRGVQMIGVESERESGVSSYSSWVIDGNFDFDVGPSEEKSGILPCVIGRANASKMEVEIGDWAILSIAGKEGNFQSARCRITGIFQAPAGSLEKFLVFLRRKDLSILFAGNENQLSYISFMTGSLDEAAALQDRIKNRVGKFRGIEILRYDQLEKGFRQLLDLMDSFSFVAYLILLLGVALILFDSVTMSVYERMKEIGIIRAIGSRASMVFWMVLYESVFLATTGSIAGVVLGWFITLYFQFYGLDLSAFAKGLESMGGVGSTIYPYLTWNNAIQGILVAMGVSFFSGFFPARKAVKIAPVNAIYNR